MIDRPRRFAALVTLLLSSTAVGSPGHAQGRMQYDSSKNPDAPRQAPQKKPLGMSKERQLWLFARACNASVSSWISTGDRVLCTTFVDGKPDSKGHLFLEDRAFVIAPGKAMVDGTDLGANCELDITYTAEDGLRPVLVCELLHPELQQQPVRILADGIHVAEFRINSKYQNYELGPAFKWDSARMTKIRDLEIVLNFHGKAVTLFKAQLSDPAGDIDALKRAVNDQDALVSLSSGSHSAGPARKDCFLSEACCTAVGLSDDCFELTALRRYRDRVLAVTPGGAAAIELYYSLAPVFLRALQRERSDRELLRLYFTHILPCAVLAACGLNGAVYRRYDAMMVRLCERLAPDRLPLVQGVSRRVGARVSPAE